MSWTDVDGTVEIGSGSLTGDRTGGTELPLVGGVGGEFTTHTNVSEHWSLCHHYCHSVILMEGEVRFS